MANEPKHIKHLQLPVSDLHTVDVRTYGNPKGKPVVFLHGGPGGGCSPSNTEFFDLEKWYVVLFDQRGCGASTPFAELRENTTWDLVADIEKIREALEISKWTVFGGSWGSTLSLAYAQTHPDRCQGLVLRGIFLCEQDEIDWLYEGGAARIFPDAYEDFLKPIANVSGRNNVDKYHKLLTSNDEKVMVPAAQVWTLFETRQAYLETSQEELRSSEDPKFALPFARIENHYFQNNSFFTEKTALLNNLDKIKHIPTYIVHGRYDAVCIPQVAWRLHKLLPQSKLYIVPKSGHSAKEPGITAKLKDCVHDMWSRV